VHAVDLALEHWIAESTARGVLHFVRGQVIRRHLRDPKTALDDLRQAEDAAPDWLRREAIAAHAHCEEEARSSRKRKPSVGPAPSFAGTENPLSRESPSAPPLWERTYRIIEEQGIR
jgi:hypothetical protein